MIIKELKDKDQIIKELIDSEPGRTGYFVCPETPLEDRLANNIFNSLRHTFDPQYQLATSLHDLRSYVDGELSRLDKGASSILRPNGFRPPSADDKAP